MSGRRQAGGFAGVRHSADHGVAANTLSGAARKPVKPHADRMLDVECWCHRKVVRVTESQLALGRTSSCGEPWCVAPAGYVEAERACCDCGDLFTPLTARSRRCASCNAVKHMG